MPSDLYAFDDDEAHPKGREHLFLWTVFILLLIAMAFACWLGSFYVFGHPEQPRSYAILKKLKKIEAPRRFEVTQAPPGEFLTPQKLFLRYSSMTPLQLDNENAELMRNYIKNFKETRKLVPYITGRFEIVDTYELQPGDLFSTGVVALGAAEDYSQVIIEHVFTTAPESVEMMKTNLPRGLDIRLERSRDLAAVIHIERTEDGRLLFTAVPLLYGAWGVKGSIGSFSLEPPADLNLKGGAPIVHGDRFANAMKLYATTRKPKPADSEASAPTASEPELVRVETVAPGSKVPETGALPTMAIATPIPAATPRGGKPTPAIAIASTKPVPTPKATPTQLAMVATPAPLATPRSTPQVTSSGVTLKPFIQSAQMPNTAVEPGTWRTYARGQQPPGRSITSSEASTMADRGDIAEHLYLHGNFVVTASGENRAVLRPPADSGNAGANGMGAARIIVEYPPSAAPPPEGSTLTRDDAGFEVRAVRKSQDGQINIYVREITGG